MTDGAAAGATVVNRRQPLIVLGTAVMNVSISRHVVDDFDTEVTTIQAVITFYSLVMAAFMITARKLVDLWGRRRAFVIGLVVYGVCSLFTSLAPAVGVLALGRSVIEGLDAALALACMVALVAGNYAGKDRALTYGVLGGRVTTNLTWRHLPTTRLRGSSAPGQRDETPVASDAAPGVRELGPTVAGEPP